MAISIQQTSLQKARRDAAAGVVREVSDLESRGLTLRVQPTGCVWHSRFRDKGRDYRIVIGPLDQWEVGWARDANRAIRWHVTAGHGVPSQAWIDDVRLTRLGEERRRKAVEPREELLPSAWTFGNARDRWIEWMKAEAKEGHYAEATISSYRRTLTSPSMRGLEHVKIAAITPSQIQTRVDDLARDGKRTAARDIVRKCLLLWRWCAGPGRSLQSGVKPGAMTSLEAPKLAKRRQYLPSMVEVATIATTAQLQVLDETVADATLLLTYTAQRRTSIVTARRDEFEAWEDGWGIWEVGHRKTVSDAEAEAVVPHAIPLPPVAWQMVERRLASGDSAWLFPQVRARRAGDELTHLAPDTLSHALPTIPGVTATPHGIRRAFSTYLVERYEFLIAETALILDHTEGDSSITRRHYNRAAQLRRKKPMVAAWAELIDLALQEVELPELDALKREIARRRDRLRGTAKKRRPRRSSEDA